MQNPFNTFGSTGSSSSFHVENQIRTNRNSLLGAHKQVEDCQNQVLDKIFNALNAPVENQEIILDQVDQVDHVLNQLEPAQEIILDQIGNVLNQLEPAQERILDQVDNVLNQLDPCENPEENEDGDEDEDRVMPVTEKERNDAAYKTFKKQLESLMTQKIAKKFFKLSFDEMRTRDDCKEKGIGDTLKEINF